MNKRTGHAPNSYPIRAKLSWFFLVSLLLSSTMTVGAPVPVANHIITSLALKQDQVANLDRGEIVALEIGEATEKELAISLGIYLPLAPAKLMAYFKSGALASIDPNTIELGDIQPKSDVDAFKRFAFSFKQSDEAKGLLDATANDRFNLSTVLCQQLGEMAAMGIAKPSIGSGLRMLRAGSYLILYQQVDMGVKLFG
jgi:hypothetical protein